MRSSGFSKEKGSYLVEIMIGLAVLSFIAVVTMSKGEGAKLKGDEMVMKDHFNMIIEGARKEAKSRYDGYANITMTLLSAAESVPITWGDGSGVNPFNGDYNLNGSTATELVVNATSVETVACTNLARAFSLYINAVCNSGTLTLTVR